MNLPFLKWAALFGGLALAGCTTAPPASPSLTTSSTAAHLASLPALKPGDQLRYDRGSRLKAVEVGDEIVTWRRGKSTTIVKPRNPFLPYIEFENRRVRVTSTIDAAADTLFPLQIGNQASFTETRTSIRKRDNRRRDSTRMWNCEVMSREPIEVKAGRFDTFKVRCENPADDAFFRTARAYEWHYAPGINAVVKERYERFRRAPRHRELVSISSPELLARGETFEATLQQTLETNRSGDIATWSDPNTGQQGIIEVTRTFRADAGHYCRDAEITLANFVVPKTQSLRACRNEVGIWKSRLP